MCYRMSEISRHPVVAATRALRFADHVTKRNEGSGNENGRIVDAISISYPESSGSLVSGLVARRDSGEMEFFPQKSGVPVVVRMPSFIKTEVNVSREVGMLDESLDGNQKS